VQRVETEKEEEQFPIDDEQLISFYSEPSGLVAV
jgi:hypothetical protein